MLYVDTKLWLPDDLLARGDKMSMAASLEARVPLLDHRLVEFAAGLPPELKVKGFSRKYLLKKVAREWLPAPILDRPKKGFPIPMGRWLRGEAREFCRDLLGPRRCGVAGLFSPAAVERLLDEHTSPGRPSTGPSCGPCSALSSGTGRSSTARPRPRPEARPSR